MLTSLNWTAIIAAVCTVGGAFSIVFHNPALAAVFSDPNTAVEATAAVSAITGLISAFASAVHVPVIHTSSVSVGSVPTSVTTTVTK